MSIRLTVITTSYNSEKTIEDTIISVLSQNYPDIEYLIIDGGSTDDTIEIVKKYLPDQRITFVSERDDGLWDAMNKGVDLSSGEFICFLNSDDVFSSDVIVSESMLFVELNSLDFMFGFVDMFDAHVTVNGCIPNFSLSIYAT